jgi:hypothetical protein
MADDLGMIAEQLLKTHGDEGAWEKVREGILLAHEIADNYSLSVWREVRREPDRRESALRI